MVTHWKLRSREAHSDTGRFSQTLTGARTRGVAGWISDRIPHLGYGVVTALVLHQLYRSWDR